MVIEYNDPSYLFFIVTRLLLLEVFLIFGLFFIKQFISLNKERTSKQRNYMPLFIGIYFICSFFTHIFYNIGDYLNEFDHKNDTPLSLMTFRIAFLFFYLGIGFFFIFLHQKVIKGRDKYLLIIFFFVFSIISILMPDEESMSTIALIGVLFAMTMTFAYLYVSVKSKGMIKTKSLYIFFGIWVSFIGSILAAEYLPFRTLVGAFTSIGISNIVIIIGSVLIFNGFKLIVPEGEEIEESDIKLIETLGLDRHRPANITEEEVSISKEKKICLVCKGKVREFNAYICPKCETFYCAKCARALIELENMCWACSRRIDKSKPVKPYKREEEEIQVEKSEKPQKKPKTKK